MEGQGPHDKRFTGKLFAEVEDIKDGLNRDLIRYPLISEFGLRLEETSDTYYLILKGYLKEGPYPLHLESLPPVLEGIPIRYVYLNVAYRWQNYFPRLVPFCTTLG